MKTRMIAMVLACCATMTAQISDYLGPGILTRGAGQIGTRSGQDVALRFFANATGVYDNGLLPYSTDGSGQLITVGGLYGVEAALGAYGVHNFRHSRLGLDYKGTYRHYSENTFFNGSNHTLSLGYTHQKSRRLVFDMRQLAGSVSQATSFGSFSTVTDAIVNPSSLLFDNRADFLQSSLDVNFLYTDRTTFTFGGQGFGVWRKAKGLIGMQGYELHGALMHRLSRGTTVGVNYSRSHYDYPKAFGESDIDSYSGTWATQLGRYWTISASGGAYQVETQGLQRVAVDPAISALLGITTTIQTFYRKSIFPQWGVTLTRQFQRASLSFNYQSGVSAGNGVYLTSRQETGGASLSYTASRKWSFSASGNYSRMEGIGQDLQPFTQITGNTGVTYALTSPIHLFAQFTTRRLDLVDASFRRNSNRAAIGISFSPGDIPLAFR